MQVLERTVTKQNFIAALRSGEYKQLQDGRLRDDDGHVCADFVWHMLNGDSNLNMPIGGNNIFGMSNQVYNRIAHLNDSGLTFTDIADIVENHLSEDLRYLNF